MANARFRPVRGLEEKILQGKYQEGFIYFATDTGNIFIDAQGIARIPMGGRGAAIIYAKATFVQNSGDDYYTFYMDELENPDDKLKIGDLVINNDGSFYKVVDIDEITRAVTCARIAVSGTGGGGEGGGGTTSIKKRGRLTVTGVTEADLLNGDKCQIQILVTSATEDGSPVDPGRDAMKVTIQFFADNGAVPFYTDTKKVTHAEPIIYDATEFIRQSTENKIVFTVEGSKDNIFYNSGTATYFVTTHELSIDWIDSQFSANKFFSTEIPVAVNFATGADRILDVYFDDFLVYTQTYNTANTTANATPVITKNSVVYDKNTNNSTGIALGDNYNHGRHIIKAQLSLAKSNGSRGSATPMISKEIGLYVNEGQPLIWFGAMQSTYYEFDNPIVPIKVYDPNNTGDIAIYLFIDGTDALDGSYYTARNDDNSFTYWTLTNLVAGQNTTYQVRIGQDDTETWATVPDFTVLKDPRNMGIATTGLKVNVDSRGRSNSESAKKRSVLDVGDEHAVFKDFNWYNNGWIMDDTNTTCLRISNGASVNFPIGVSTFAGEENPSKTIELRLKVRNVQSYEKLITTYTRYTVIDDVAPEIKSWTDDELFKEFLDQRTAVGGYTNYDAFLSVKLPQLKEQGQNVPSYDELLYKGLYRDYNLTAAAVKYIEDGIDDSAISKTSAICLGAQDGYFTNGINAVTIDFVEDKMLNITIVYNNGNAQDSTGENRLMKVYLNGMLTSVARSTATSEWSINNKNLVINSSNCDIDLYKFRVYNRALGLTEILKNVAYDNTDTTAWDLAEMSIPNKSIDEEYQFSYDKMIKYNKEHPRSENIMPYIIFTTDQDDTLSKGNLPWRKDTPVTADMEFINTGLERAYSMGNLSAEATAAGQELEDYYLHHCPSFTAQNVALSVQGTSSEFYPRRNYKAKTKIKVDDLDADGKKQYDKYGDVIKKNEHTMVAHKGPFAADYELGKKKKLKYFYYDNNTVGCNKFTLKVDFMESSGSYNMGLANLVNYAYSHHPLEDYNGSNAFCQVDETKSEQKAIANEAGNYKAGTVYYYYNHKGNLKNTRDDELKMLSSAEDFVLGPRGLAQREGVSKVLGGIGETPSYSADAQGSAIKDKLAECTNVWYEYVSGYKTAKVDHLSDYRTSVQGFPTLAFWQTKAMKEAGTEPLFIGRYNMLLDKGAAEAYGFADLGMKQAYVDHKSTDDVAECWEFENNSRGFCSFRDPWNRHILSFKAPDTADNKYTVAKAPVVADSFEYRYNALDDYIDYLVDLKNSSQNSKTVRKLQDKLGIDIANDLDEGRNKLLEIYGNWEKAVAWVWSTATDALIDVNSDPKNPLLKEVPSLNTYVQVALGEKIFEAGTFYFESTETGQKVKAQVYSKDTTYYELQADGEYRKILLTDDPELVYKKNKFYTKNSSGNYLLAEENFVETETYYKAVNNESSIEEFWKLPAPVQYGNTTYNYDTKEYRLAKFKNELTDHFNLEYLATYFVITEVLECYDSRGKNCMMASWGPQKKGGDYIWYPIFYDMDTQLGINNTGIPSFEYNIDATDDGTFSTNDSVLWNNFYSLFLGIIKDKYEQLTGVPSSNFGTLKKPPFTSIDVIENIYKCNPEFTKSHSMEGLRPLLAMNLDEHYKYISITNPKVGYLGSGTTPELLKDTSDTYFYALQGDRSMSREQFLTNRFNYIDSWLSVGNYKRGGQNRIRSRISANSPASTSDKWIEGTATNGAEGIITNEPYYDPATGKKKHMFDGEYWLSMTPVRKMYVTVGTDTANFDSMKYTGTPVKFTTPDLENGIRKSGNYKEQLYYIYGLDQMKSLGDLSKLYFQEFELSGNATKITDLKLGYDGVDEENNHYKNANVNKWTITGSSGLPLVKEINLSYITFKDNNVTFDLSASEKLQNFRDTGSNITQVTFADGVALDTLHLSASTAALKLTEARLLTDLIETYKVPEEKDKNNPSGDLVAQKGLYIEGLTDKEVGKGTSNLTTLNIIGGGLGYNSYKLLNKFYAATASLGAQRKINMADVQWSPYVLVDDPEATFSASSQYFRDDGHFGLIAFTAEDYKAHPGDWVQYINNSQMYEYDSTMKTVDITDTKLLENLITNASFIGVSSGTKVPTISGYIYINNETAVEESAIQDLLVKNYPNLTFFFKKVTKGFAARFVIQDKTIDSLTGVATTTETLIGTDKIGLHEFETNPKIFFTNPKDRTESAFSETRINALKPSQDFIGWSTTPDRTGLIESYDTNWVTLLGNSAIHNWGTQQLLADKTDYTFYAVFEDHHWDVRFYLVNDDGSEREIENTYGNKIGYSVVHGSALHDPNYLVQNPKEDSLPITSKYRFLGYTRRISGENNIYGSATLAPVVDLTTIKATQNLKFYAAFSVENVYDNPTDDKYFEFNWQTDQTYSIRVKPGVSLTGKITIPKQHDDKVHGKADISIIQEFSNQTGITHVFFYEDAPLKYIKENAFQNCSQMKYCYLPNNLIEIGTMAFRMCSNLIWTGLPNKLEKIGNFAFNQALTDAPSGDFTIIIPPSVKTIGDSAFMYIMCTATLKFLYIGTETENSKLTSIQENSFAQNGEAMITDPEAKAFIYGVSEQMKPLIKKSLAKMYANPDTMIEFK